MVYYSYCLRYRYDVLNIYGYDHGVITKQIKAITGSYVEPDIYFSSSDILITFVSDEEDTEKGFRIQPAFHTSGNMYTSNTILPGIDVDYKS